VVTPFGWTQSRHLSMADLREDHVVALVAGRSRGCETQKHERATLHQFVAFLHCFGVVSTAAPTSPLDALVDRYLDAPPDLGAPGADRLTGDGP
jgi:hypothetical protein